MSFSDYPDYQTPQNQADTISNTGVPLLARPGSLINKTSTMASGSSATIAGPVTLSKIGYEISLTVFAPAAAQSLVTIQMIWHDSVSGVDVVTEEWDFYAGSGPIANAHIIRGTGPTKGDTLTIKGTTNASGVTTSYTLVVAENSRVYAIDSWRTVFMGPVTGFTVATFEADNFVLGSINSVAVAGGGGTVVSLLPLFCGKCTVASNSTSGANDMSTIISAPSAAFGSLINGTLYRQRSDAFGLTYTPNVSLPRAQCSVQQINSNAAAKDLNTFICAAEY